MKKTTWPNDVQLRQIQLFGAYFLSIVSACMVAVIVVGSLAAIGWRDTSITAIRYTDERCKITSDMKEKVYALYEYSVDGTQYSTKVCRSAVTKAPESDVISYPPNAPERGIVSAPSSQRIVQWVYAALFLGLFILALRRIRTLKQVPKP